MKKLKKLFVLMVMAISFIGSSKALDIVEDGVMAEFELRDQADIDACNRAENPSCANAWRKLKTSDGQVVYCRDVTKDWPTNSDGVDYSDGIDSMDPGLIYILENGYPNKTIIDGGDKDRYITQGAIWLYATNSNTFANNFNDPSGLLPKMQELVSTARSSDVSTRISSGIIKGFNYTSDELILDGDYYVSSVIVPQISGVSKYKVTVPGGTIVKENGDVVNPNDELNVGEGFIVKAPVSLFSSSGVVKPLVSIKTKAHMINPVGNSGFQRVIGLSTVDKELSKELTLTISPKVCVDYVIVGNVKPDPKLTDPTPDKECFDKGTPYSEKPKLTTKTNCTFNGWYTKDILTGKWVNGTALNKDMTLYGAWNCPKVTVPPTAANTPLIILGVGFLSIAVGFGYYSFYHKKSNK